MNDTILVNGNNVMQNYLGLCVGDVNGSNFPLPGAKSSPKIELFYQDFIRLNSNESFELPIITTSDISIGAISMILKFPKELVKIDKVQYSMKNEGNSLIYNIMGNELRVGWYEVEDAIRLKNNEPVIIISGKTTENFKEGDFIMFSIANNSLCEFADESGNTIDKVILKSYLIEHANSQNIESKSSVSNNDLFIFPNPAENTVNIRYSTANDGFVNISLYDVLGEKFIDVINKPLLKGIYYSVLNLSAVPSGVYTCKMVLGDGSVVLKRLVVSK